MNPLSTLCLLLVSLALLSRSAVGQTKQNWCGTPDKMQWLKYRAADIAKELERTTIASPATGKESSENAVEVVEVHDQAICERATRAYYRDRLGPYPADGVAVVRIGDSYGVYGSIRGGEWTLLVVYNLNFEPIGGFWS
jgi:hypothetical protein